MNNTNILPDAGKTSQAPSFGYEAGEICWRNGCQGMILGDYDPDGGCSCHINPPCGYCTTAREYCPECDWTARDEGDHLNGFIASVSAPYKWEPRPLDPRKIDYRSSSHSHSSMIKEGVYPVADYATESEARAAVRKVVDGTFGGRFETFGGGKFKFIAYTD